MAGLALAGGLAFVVAALLDGPPPQGAAQADEDAVPDREALLALGYVGHGTRDQTSATNVVTSSDGASDGLVFYVSSHAPGASLALGDGTVIYRWEMPFDRIWPDGPQWRDALSRRLMANSSHDRYWRRAFVRPDGSVVAIFENIGLVKVSRDSEIEWSSRVRAHHDLETDEQGRFWVLTRKPRRITGFDGLDEIMDNLVTILGPGGDVIEEISLIDALERSASTAEWRTWIDDPQQRPEDPLHANSLHLVRDGSTSFEPGHVLVSIRNLNAVVVLDPETARIVWTQRGEFRAQHDAELTSEGHLLLFDNLGEESWSRVLEYGIRPPKLIWKYEGRPEDRFFSAFQGTVQRLPNGHTLIVPSATGTALEVDAEGRVPWRFSSGHRARSKTDKVAALFDLQKLPLDSFEPEFRELLKPR